MDEECAFVLTEEQQEGADTEEYQDQSCTVLGAASE